jgi:hypothetical protein
VTLDNQNSAQILSQNENGTQLVVFGMKGMGVFAGPYGFKRGDVIG